MAAMDPEEIAKLKADPSVIWLDEVRYRLKGDPNWLTRRTRPVDPIPRRSNSPPEIKRGTRGGRYTEARTKDGRPYRRYF